MASGLHSILAEPVIIPYVTHVQLALPFHLVLTLSLLSVWPQVSCQAWETRKGQAWVGGDRGEQFSGRDLVRLTGQTTPEPLDRLLRICQASSKVCPFPTLSALLEKSICEIWHYVVPGLSFQNSQ